MPPPLEQADLTERAMYWQFVRNDKYGARVLQGPIEIPVRWEEGNIVVPDPQGLSVTVDAVIATDRRLPIGSILWEGSEEDLECEPGTAMVPSGDLYEVLFRIRALDISGRFERTEFALKRYSDTLPKVE